MNMPSCVKSSCVKRRNCWAEEKRGRERRGEGGRERGREGQEDSPIMLPQVHPRLTVTISTPFCSSLSWRDR